MAAFRVFRRLAELLDVSVSSPADGEVLTYDTATSKWRNEAGAGSSSTSREEVSGGGVTIADASGDWLTWTATGGPDTVLDLSVPAHPTVIAAGVYLVSVVVNVAGLNPDGYYDAGLHLDRTGFNASMYARSSVAGADPNHQVSDVVLSFAWYCPANAQIGVFVDNFDGSLSRAFSITAAHVQRLS